MDGANNGTTFTDWSPSPKTVTRNGDAKTVTAQSKYYGSSGYFDGSGDSLSYGYSSDFNLSGGDFTISAWVRPVGLGTGSYLYASILGKRNGATDWDYGLWVNSNGACFFNWGDGSAGNPVINTAVGKIPLNTWTHVAVVLSGTSIKIYINGVASATGSLTGSLKNRSLPTLIGHTSTSFPDSYWNGYIQDLLIIKGAALWTSNFEPPSRLIGSVSGTILDELGNPVSRNVIVMPRQVPSKLYQALSDVSTGSFTIRAPSTECNRIVLHEGSPEKADLHGTVIPV